jgi:hypothetical protein
MNGDGLLYQSYTIQQKPVLLGRDDKPFLNPSHCSLSGFCGSAPVEGDSYGSAGNSRGCDYIGLGV